MNPLVSQPFAPSPLPAAAVQRRPLAASVYLLFGALSLFVMQLISGTDPVYAALVFVLLLVSYHAIRAAGGLDTVIGFSVFYLLMQHVLVSQIAKLVFWQPADSYLRQPLATLGVYIVGMSGLWAGSVLARKSGAGRRKPLFQAEIQPRRLLWTAFIAMALGILQALLIRTQVDASNGAAQQGGLLGPFKQIMIFTPLAVAAGTAYVIQKSNRRHSIGWLNGFVLVFVLFTTLVTATRSGLSFAAATYFFTCIAFGYRFRFKHLIAVIVGVYAMVFIISPFGLVARGQVRTPSFEKNVVRTFELLSEIISDPLKYQKLESHHEEHVSSRFSYYGKNNLALERYSVMETVDAVIDATLRRGTTDWTTITPAFEMLLPRFINEDKPAFAPDNYLVHREPGLFVNKDDHTTGVTLGFFADAFSSFLWLGIFVIPAILMFSYTWVYRFMINDRIWGNVLALSLMMVSANRFSEGTLMVMTIGILQNPLALAAGFWGIGSLVTGLEKVNRRASRVHEKPALARLRASGVYR